jgi:uncharacterized membrane protein HdeD (DUF308 family)
MADSTAPTATPSTAGVVVIMDARRMWPILAIRGGLAIVFGVLALVWPQITVLALALLFGAWALVDGVLHLVSAFQQGRAHAGWRGWLPEVLIGLLGIAAAVVTVLWPGVTVLVLTILAGVLLILLGAAEIWLAIRMRRAIRGEWFIGLAGLIAVVAGALILIWPSSGALALTIMLGAFALIFGVLLLVVAFRLRRLTRTAQAAASRQTGSSPTGTPETQPS